MMTIQESVPLAPLTSMRVGGPARYLAEAESEDDVREAVRFARARKLPLFVLGGGSNLVVADSGWPGLVLKVAIGEISSQGSSAVFDAGAGVNWDDLVAEAVSRNCAGVECLSGIPGSVGGTPVQNVGAYGQEVSETIESVRVLDVREDRVSDFDRQACGFRYRASIFNTTERGRYIILRVSFRLIQDGAPSLKYADLKKHFSAAPNSAVTRPGARSSAPDSAQQGHVDRARRRGLPKRGILLQESGPERRPVPGPRAPRGVERSADSELSRARRSAQGVGGLAGGTFRIR